MGISAMISDNAHAEAISRFMRFLLMILRLLRGWLIIRYRFRNIRKRFSSLAVTVKSDKTFAMKLNVIPPGCPLLKADREMQGMFKAPAKKSAKARLIRNMLLLVCSCDVRKYTINTGRLAMTIRKARPKKHA